MASTALTLYFSQLKLPQNVLILDDGARSPLTRATRAAAVPGRTKKPGVITPPPLFGSNTLNALRSQRQRPVDTRVLHRWKSFSNVSKTMPVIPCARFRDRRWTSSSDTARRAPTAKTTSPRGVDSAPVQPLRIPDVKDLLLAATERDCDEIGPCIIPGMVLGGNLLEVRTAMATTKVPSRSVHSLSILFCGCHLLVF